MIRLDRTNTPIPATLRVDGRRASIQLKRQRTLGKTEFKFMQRIYAAQDVRTALRTIHRGKCAFCETPLPQLTAGHVEHYRPKGEVQQDEGGALMTPGYYWLAYEWSNLLLACEWCNTRAKRKLFPLSNPSQRARTHKDRLEIETPLLLNPAIEDPAAHIEFVEEVIKPKAGSTKGGKSIKVYRLDDPGLTEHRRKKLYLFRALRDLARHANPKPEVYDALREAKEWVARIKSGDIEYAAMLRTNL